VVRALSYGLPIKQPEPLLRHNVTHQVTHQN
jgi:hypothetical protein